MMTKEQHKKLQDLYALCGVCKYQNTCATHSIRGKCPNTTGELEAFELPKGYINFDHFATKVATERIHWHLKEIRKLASLVSPDNSYMAMFLLSNDSGNPGRISFNNEYWNLPRESKINFLEPVEEEVSVE